MFEYNSDEVIESCEYKAFENLLTLVVTLFPNDCFSITMTECGNYLRSHPFLPPNLPFSSNNLKSDNGNYSIWR